MSARSEARAGERGGPESVWASESLKFFPVPLRGPTPAASGGDDRTERLVAPVLGPVAKGGLLGEAEVLGPLGVRGGVHRQRRGLAAVAPDAQRDLLGGFAKTLGYQVSEAASGEEALAAIGRQPPDIVLLDLSLPAPGGIETTQRVKREVPSAGIIALAATEDEDMLFEAIKAGAAAFLLKDIGPEDLVTIIRRVNGGEYLINDKVFARPSVANRVLKEFRELAVYGQEAAPIFAPLSPREVEILDNIAKGMTNKQVAYALSISEQTVKNHMSSILRKLSVNDRTQAVVYAMKQGWIRIPED